jgi:arabinofuranan 3-O-arabinosyltransferase
MSAAGDRLSQFRIAGSPADLPAPGSSVGERVPTSGRHRATRTWLGSQLLGAIRGDPADAGTASVLRWTILVGSVAMIVLVADHPGQIFFDTKLGVDIDPLGFLGRLWHLWNPLEYLGSLQNQYIGYAIPMAPFYLAGQLLKFPVWLTERIWLSVLIAVGFAGLVKLGAALRIGSARSRVVAGLAFALWPTFTITIGSTSAGLLPGLLAPWAVLPLVTAARGGPLPRAAARSGIAIVLMGGVNAASTLAVLILPACFILTHMRGKRMATMAAYWAAAVAVATSWWAVPLLLQARYSFNFLPYIEQSAVTTGTMSAATFLRGAGNWTAYLNLGQPWLQAGWMTVSNPLAIMAGAIAAATGLVGLARRDLPSGGWLRLTLGAAALVALVGYAGPLGSPLHHGVDQLLNGVLAPLRSVYKVEPAAAAALALGIAHAIVLKSWRPAFMVDPAHRTLWRILLAPLIVLVLAGLALPYVTGQVLNAGSFTRVPVYWYRVAAFLRVNSPHAPALVVPGAAHGNYLWGNPIDDPLEPLARSPWVALGLVPYAAGSQLLLSSVQSALVSDEPVPGLASTLARSGIRYLVVRNDLDPAAIGYISPQVVHQVLAESGFRRVAAFGPPINSLQYDPAAQQIGYALASYPAVEVFEARSAMAHGPPAAAVALPVSRTVLINGGPDALLQLTGQHILTSAPAIVAGDRLVSRPAAWAVTDSLPRSDHTFGLINQAASYTYTPAERNPVDDPLGGAGEQPRQLLPVLATGHQTVAVLAGAASVTASSSGSWLSETPQFDPVNAFDGNPNTVWTEANPANPVGQWIQITFAHPVNLPSAIAIRLIDDRLLRPLPDRLTVRTAKGAVTDTMQATGAAQPLRVPPGLTRTLRITIAGARGGFPGGPGAGIADVVIPGVTVTKYLRPPESRPGQRAGQVSFSFDRQVPSPASLVNVAGYPPLDRTFVTPHTTSFRLSASAIALPGPGLDALLSRLTPARKNTLEVTASSTFGSLPSLSPANLFVPGRHDAWIAGGQNAVLRLGWQGMRTISRMVVQSVPGFAAAPATIKITSPNGVRFASVGLDGLTEIVPPLTTDQISISFLTVQYATTIQPVTGQPVQLPVGLSRLSIPALGGLSPQTLGPSAPVTLPCGHGPPIMVDGRTFQTSVGGNAGDLTGFRPVTVSLCTPGSMLRLGAGLHWLRVAKFGTFSITGLALTQPTGQNVGGPQSIASAPPANRRVRVLAWQPEFRKVRVASGVESYLEIHQNANPGWVATLHGHRLLSVRLDGWQQGFVVPAGTGGVVTMTFRPVTFYHVWIILSALGVLILAVIAIGRRRTREGRRQMRQTGPVEAGGSSVLAGPQSGSSRGVVAPGPQSGSSRGVVAPGPQSGSPRRLVVWSVLGLLATCALVYVAGGPVAAAVPVLVLVAAFLPGWYGALAFAGMTTAGVLAALAPHPDVSGTGAFSAAAQACALVALAVALTPTIPAGLMAASRRSLPGTSWRAARLARAQANK